MIVDTVWKAVKQVAGAILGIVISAIAFALLIASCIGILSNWPVQVEHLQCGIALRAGTSWQALFDIVFWFGRPDPEPWGLGHMLGLSAIVLTFTGVACGFLLSTAPTERKSNVIMFLCLVFVGVLLGLFTQVRYETVRWLVGFLPESATTEDTVERVKDLEINRLPSLVPSDEDFCVLIKNETNEDIAYATKVEGVWYHDILEAGECAQKCWPDNAIPWRPLVFIGSRNNTPVNCSKWFLYSIMTRASCDSASLKIEEVMMYRLRKNARERIEMISPQIRPLQH